MASSEALGNASKAEAAISTIEEVATATGNEAADYREAVNREANGVGVQKMNDAIETFRQMQQKLEELYAPLLAEQQKLDSCVSIG
ncbi:Protein of unknown function [Pyronema omphalodes CBS 100304]|uniref:Uncharacterized protein n=1 Tax=Pyronema omphalodes (strain CBS 100304) TaxID=1076935 RepID=U4LRA8_PYROM|nr:Protein of unknown function [Pyronema omphalodes CBS 100304]